MKTQFLLTFTVTLFQFRVVDAGIGFRQSVAAAGRLICNGMPSAGTWVLKNGFGV